MSLFFPTLSKHFRHVKKIRRILQNGLVSSNLEETHFSHIMITYVGKIVERGRLKIEFCAIAASKETFCLCRKQNLHTFPGFCNVSHRLVQNFAHSAGLFSEMIQNSALKLFEILASKNLLAFESFIEALTRAPISHLPPPRQPYSVDTAALDYHVGCVLLRTNAENILCTIFIFSRTL